MGDNFEPSGCSTVSITGNYHPLAQAIFDAAKTTMHEFLTPQVRTAIDKAVKATRQWLHPEVIIGDTQLDSWIGKKIIQAMVGNYIDEPNSGVITFNSLTGQLTVAAGYENTPIVLLMGYEIDAAVEDYEING